MSNDPPDAPADATPPPADATKTTAGDLGALPIGAPHAPTPLAGPVRHDNRAVTRDQPLVFARAGAQPPDLDVLARRVAHSVDSAPPATASGAPPASFGTRQRWSLTRLAFSGQGHPRLVVRRPLFIRAEDLVAWRDAPPPDAVALPDDADSLIDGVTPADAVAFYAVLVGPAPWRPLPVEVVPPPFDQVARPFPLGAPEQRLEAALAALLADPRADHAVDATLLELAAAAVAWLPADHPLRARVTDRAGALREA